MASRIILLDRALAERSFLDFVRQAWPVLEPKTPYQGNWHHELLAEALEAVAAGELRKLIINMPPRSGKSLLVSVFFPCWLWLRAPWERMLFASYSAVLATKHSVDRRALIQSPWYVGNWGIIVRLAEDSNLKTEFSNMARGHMIATSVGASATGRGGNFIICDDLINPDQANSDVERARALRWLDETFSTRLDDKKTGRQIVFEQRTHTSDPTGHLLDQGGWHHIALPAVAERKTIIDFPRSHKQRVREEGDILWRDHEGPAELEDAKLRLGPYAYSAQYQQAPVARGGNLIKQDWLSATYRALPARFDSLVLSLDTAFKTGASNDYSAAIVIGTLNAPRDGSPPGHYLLEAWRGKLEFAALKRKIVELYATWHPHAVLVEDAASGQSLIQELRSGTNLPLKPIRPDRDKLERMAAVTPVLEARRVLLPETAWWRADLISELISFPAGAHDDWCDALAMALNYLRGAGTPSIITFQKMRCAVAWVREGRLSLEEAAGRAEVTTAELERWLEPKRRPLEDNPWLPKPPAGTALDPPPWDAARLVEAARTGHCIHIDVDTYRLCRRNALKIYAATCDDPDTREAALKLIDELDRRFRI